MVSPKKPLYNDFITEKPLVILKITAEQRNLLKEHSTILRALAKNTYLSVKEIHKLYKVPLEKKEEKKEKFTKSMKTIYRYMELLEDSGLVKVAGFRKPSDSRMSEKLYCRTANIFFFKEKDEKDQYWKSEEFKQLYRLIAKIFCKNNHLSLDLQKKIENLIELFSEKQAHYLNRHLEQIEQNLELANEFKELPIMDIKRVITDVTIYEIIFNHPDLISQFQKLRSKFES